MESKDSEDDLNLFMEPYLVGNQGLPRELSEMVHQYYNLLELWTQGQIRDEEVATLPLSTILENLEDLRLRGETQTLEHIAWNYPLVHNLLEWAIEAYQLGYKELSLYLLNMYLISRGQEIGTIHSDTQHHVMQEMKDFLIYVIDQEDLEFLNRLVDNGVSIAALINLSRLLRKENIASALIASLGYG